MNGVGAVGSTQRFVTQAPAKQTGVRAVVQSEFVVQAFSSLFQLTATLSTPGCLRASLYARSRLSFVETNAGTGSSGVECESCPRVATSVELASQPSCPMKSSGSKASVAAAANVVSEPASRPEAPPPSAAM